MIYVVELGIGSGSGVTQITALPTRRKAEQWIENHIDEEERENYWATEYYFGSYFD